MYKYYDYFKSPHDGKFYVVWHEGGSDGLYRPWGMTEEEAKKLVDILMH